MPSIDPVLCFSGHMASEQLLSFARTQGEKWRDRFRRKIGDKQYRLIDGGELFERDGVCAFFNGANLRVSYFSRNLSGLFSQLNGPCDLGGFQRVHDRIAEQTLAKTAGTSVQLPQFWILLLHLLNDGILREDEPDQTIRVRREVERNRFTSMIIMPSLDCNYRCDYCYHRGIAEDSKKGSVATIEQVKAALDCLLANASAPPESPRSIRFTGGEPTLHYDLVRDSLDYIAELRSRNPGLGPFRISMVTNGSLIDDRWVELIKKHGISIAVSLDGTEARNDLRRKSREGRAYAKTTAGLERLGRAGIRPTIFVTVSAHNIASLSEDVTWLFEHFDLGGFSLNLDTSGISKYRVPPAEYVQGLFKAYDDLGKRGLFDAKVLKAYEKFKAKEITITGCGAIFAHLVLLPDGTIGPCPRCVDSTERMEIGDEPLNDSRLFRRWCGYSHTLNGTCQKCPYRNFCEGWCAETSFQFHGRPWEPNEYTCLYTRQLMEWLVWSDFQERVTQMVEAQT